MSELVTYRDRASDPVGGESLDVMDRILHDFGERPLPAPRWVAQPRPTGGHDMPGGAEARLSGTLQLGPMALYVELVEVGYTGDGFQEFVAEEGAGADECERTCGPDIHRALNAPAETFLWQGREYALIVLPYGR